MNQEDQLQITIMDWLRYKHPDVLAIHIPNGGSRHIIEASKFKRMGVKAGIPDLFIPRFKQVFNGDRESGAPVSRIYCGFFCEIKVEYTRRRKLKDGSYTIFKVKNEETSCQKAMRKRLSDLGYYCCVVYTLDEFIKEWEGYCG